MILSSSSNGTQMFSNISVKVEELDNAIENFHQFLKKQEMYSYFNGLLVKFFQLSEEMKGRVTDISTLYDFLNNYQLSASKTSAGYFSVLPQELCLHILSFLSWKDLLNVSFLNRQWKELSLDNMLWRTMCAKHWKSSVESKVKQQEDSGEQKRKRARKRQKRCWKEVFMNRVRVDENWRRGIYQKTQVSAKVSSLAFCLQFDENYLVTATDVIQVLDVNTGKWLRTMMGHEDSVMCLDFDDKYIVSGSKDNSIRVWNIETSECEHLLESHNNGVRTLRFDSRHIVSGARDSTIKVWDLATGTLHNTLRGHHYTVYCLEFDDQFIISGSVDKTIRLWDRETGENLKEMKGHSNSIRCLKFDRQRIVSGAWDNHVKVWDMETGTDLMTYRGHKDRVMCLQFDERKIVSGSVDKTIKIWDMRGPEKECITLNGHEHIVYHLMFDDFKIVSASKDRTIINWDFTVNQEVDRITSPCTKLVPSPTLPDVNFTPTNPYFNNNLPYPTHNLPNVINLTPPDTDQQDL